MDTWMRGEAAFRRVKEDGPSRIMEYGYKFKPSSSGPSSSLESGIILYSESGNDRSASHRR
jgi:hypothetical protein